MSAPIPSLFGTVFNLIDTKSILHLGSMLGGGGQKGGYPFYFDNAEKLGLSRKKYLTLEKSKPKGMKMKTWVQMNQKKQKPKRSKKKATKKRRQHGGTPSKKKRTTRAGPPKKQTPRKKQTKSKSMKTQASKFLNNNSSPIGGLLYSSV